MTFLAELHFLDYTRPFSLTSIHRLIPYYYSLIISKNMSCLQAIGHLEGKMDTIVVYTKREIPNGIGASRFKIEDLLTILQGSCGFVSGAASTPLELLGPTLEVVLDLSDILTCPIGSLEDISDKLHKWLTFGSSYKPLEDSSDLDFDQVDIGSVPEMMQVRTLEKLTFVSSRQ